MNKPTTRVFKLDEKAHSLVSSHAPSKASNFLVEISILMKIQSQYCDSLLNNKHLMEEVKTADLIIGDSFYLCSSLIADKFSLPHVTMVMTKLFLPTMIAFGVHQQPSYVPQLLLGFAGDLRFLQRVQNIFSWIVTHMAFHFVICPAYDEVKVKHDIAPNKSIRETLGRVDLIIGQVDFPIEVPRPLLPSKYVSV